MVSQLDKFPAVPYEAVHAQVGARWSQNPSYSEYAGAWDALAYRFHGAVDAGAIFQRSLKDFGSHPAPRQRYQQEEALFNFFSNGFAAFEAMFYGLFAVGSFIDPSSFPLSTSKERQRVSPLHTANAFSRAFADDPIIDIFAGLFADPSYQRWRDVRNVLTHRSAPGRRVYVGIGTDDAPPVEWKLNDLPLDTALVPNYETLLANLLSNVLIGFEIFLNSRM